MINIESIGGRMIEVHLRMSDQWPDLYGAGWVETLVRLYHEGRWAFADRDRRDGYSVMLFAPHGPRYRHPPPRSSRRCARCRTCRASRSPSSRTRTRAARHAAGRLPARDRQCLDLEAGQAGRELLRAHFLP